jgi:multidrug efflux pump
MAGLQQQAANAILEDPAVDTLSSFIGVDGANNSMLHTGQMLINLKKDRSGSQEKIMQRLRASAWPRCRASPSISSRPRT